jgi:hypothetical protein
VKQQWRACVHRRRNVGVLVGQCGEPGRDVWRRRLPPVHECGGGARLSAQGEGRDALLKGDLLQAGRQKTRQPWDEGRAGRTP